MLGLLAFYSFSLGFLSGFARVKAAGAVDRDSGLVAVLKSDSRRLAVLTDYVRYPYSTQIQVDYGCPAP